jgi:sigma-B regulation protein RsbQ
VLPTFEQRYQVVRYDLTGLGRSDKSAYDRQRYATLQGHAEDLLELCDALSLDEVVFVGHSVSAMIGLLAAASEPQRFRKLALVAASPCYRNDGDYRGGMDDAQLEAALAALCRDYLAWCDMMVPIAADAPPEDELTRELLATFKAQDAAISDHVSKVIFGADHRAVLRKVQTECLVVQATHDLFVPESVARYLRDELPNAKLRMLQGRGGHYPHLGNPEEVIFALREFLSR